MLPGSIFVVALQRVAQTIPDSIIRRHLRQLFQLIHNFVDLVLERLPEIAVLLFPADGSQFVCQIQQLLLDGRGRGGDGFHTVNEFTHDFSRCFSHFFVCHILLDIDFFQLIRVDRIGQNRLHMQQFVFSKETILWIVRPEHHMDMRMLALIVKCRVPVKIFRWDLHGFCKVVLMSQQRQAPAFRIVIAKPRGILAAQGINDRPDVSLMRFQFLHGFFQIDVRFCAKESMPFVLFRAWAGGNIAHINALCVLIQDFYTVARGDVFHVTAGSFFAEKATFLNQFCHPLQRLFLLQYVHKRDFSVRALDLIHAERVHFHVPRRVNVCVRSKNVIVDVLLDRQLEKLPADTLREHTERTVQHLL